MPKVFVISDSMFQADSAEEAARIFVSKRGIPEGNVMRVVDWDANVEYFEVIVTEKYGASPLVAVPAA